MWPYTLCPRLQVAASQYVGSQEKRNFRSVDYRFISGLLMLWLLELNLCIFIHIFLLHFFWLALAYFHSSSHLAEVDYEVWMDLDMKEEDVKDVTGKIKLQSCNKGEPSISDKRLGRAFRHFWWTQNPKVYNFLLGISLECSLHGVSHPSTKTLLLPSLTTSLLAWRLQAY